MIILYQMIPLRSASPANRTNVWRRGTNDRTWPIALSDCQPLSAYNLLCAVTNGNGGFPYQKIAFKYHSDSNTIQIPLFFNVF